MPTSAETLNELIQIARDGQVFYAQAITHVRSARLKSLFRGCIDAKSQLIDALAEHVRARGTAPAAGGTVAGNLQRIYGAARAKLAHEQDAAFVAHLEESESRLVEAFEAAAHDADPTLRAIIMAHLPKVRLCHDEMRNLKIALAA